jgi:hypothetical protein
VEARASGHLLSYRERYTRNSEVFGLFLILSLLEAVSCSTFVRAEADPSLTIDRHMRVLRYG